MIPPYLKCCWFWREREREEIKAALFLFSFCFVALPLIRNTTFLTQLSVQSLYLLITTARLAKQRFSRWWMFIECKVQWIKGLDIVPKGAAEGEDERETKMHNYAVQQGEGIKILPFLTLV